MIDRSIWGYRLEENPDVGPNNALYQWDEKLHAAAQQQGGDLTQAQRTFWTALLVCNSLIVEADTETGGFNYQVLPSLFDADQQASFEWT